MEHVAVSRTHSRKTRLKLWDPWAKSFLLVGDAKFVGGSELWSLVHEPAARFGVLLKLPPWFGVENEAS
jgi:hypothetical protein